MMTTIVVWGLTAIAAAAVAGIVAGIKNRDVSFWIAWSFLVPPLLVVLLCLPKYGGPRPKRRSLDEEDQANA